MYIIALPENQLLRNEAGEIQRFKNTTSARDYLRDIGIRKPEKEGITIVPEKAASEPTQQLA
jgi:hypothetical protein